MEQRRPQRDSFLLLCPTVSKGERPSASARIYMRNGHIAGHALFTINEAWLLGPRYGRVWRRGLVTADTSVLYLASPAVDYYGSKRVCWVLGVVCTLSG